MLFRPKKTVHTFSRCSLIGEICVFTKPFCDLTQRKCVECFNPVHCPSEKPLCSENVCKECIHGAECISDTNCDRSCVDGICTTNANVDCLVLDQVCNVYTRECVECLQHTDCPPNRPYCDRFFNDRPEYKCEECFVDSHCQSDSNCNARCENRECVNDVNVLDCTQTPETPRCNKDKQVCQRCTLESHCANELFLKRCWGGECQQCTSNSDCRSNGNCNAQCIQKSNKLVCDNSGSQLVCCGNQECNLHRGVCKLKENSCSTITFNLVLIFILGMISIIL